MVETSSRFALRLQAELHDEASRLHNLVAASTFMCDGSGAGTANVVDAT